MPLAREGRKEKSATLDRKVAPTFFPNFDPFLAEGKKRPGQGKEKGKKGKNFSREVVYHSEREGISVSSFLERGENGGRGGFSTLFSLPKGR